MKKIIIAAVAAIILIGAAGGGAYFYFFKLKHHGDGKTAAVSAQPPKPLLFAQLTNLVVSVPQTASAPGAGDASEASPPNQVFIQLSVQFATTDPKAVASFNALLPIIQADMVSLLMKHTATDLMNPDTHRQLSADFLAIANGVLAQNQYFKPQNPFKAAYITSIVQQD